jgi:hypothetical protein
VCHGRQGKGDGIMSAYYRAGNAIAPADLTAATTQARTDGDLYYILTYGRWSEQTRVGMPPFRTLLNSGERWILVRYIRSMQGG